MLWLYKFKTAPGDFFERLLSHQSDWIGAHLILFGSAILLIPASLALYSLTRGRKGELLAEFGLVLVVGGSFFLAGQYAIDFLMPLLATTGGEALQVHPKLFSTTLINILFYNVPDLLLPGAAIAHCRSATKRSDLAPADDCHCNFLDTCAGRQHPGLRPGGPLGASAAGFCDDPHCSSVTATN